jgi:integrase|tara:strand:- start:370 stop:1548 length:1179 start_codon:yes stop_codon:yes gene_type:complete
MGNKRSGVSIASESSIALCFTYQYIPCKERIKTRGKPTSADIDAGKRKLRQINDAILDGTFNYSDTFPNSHKKHLFSLGSSTKFKPFFKRWHEEHLNESGLQDATEATNSGIVKRLNENLGKYYLSDITPELIEKFFKGRKNPKTGKPITKKTIKNYLAVLRPAFQHAVREKLITENPVHTIKIKGSASKDKEAIEPFSNNEMSTLLNFSTGQIHNIVKFHYWTGLRPSELIEIKYSDIKNGKVFISRKRTADSKGPEALKTPSSYRSIKLLPDALAAVEDQKQYTYTHLKEHIFHNPNTNEIWSSPKPYREAWIRLVEKTDVIYRYPYQLRHSFATMMLGAREDLMWVSYAMGHKSTKETLDTYASWNEDNSPDVGMKAAKKFKFKPEITD